MNTTESRREFEEWARTMPIRLKLARDKEGNYIDDEVDIAWEAWQAARERQDKDKRKSKCVCGFCDGTDCCGY